MKLIIENKDEWINEQLEILNSEYKLDKLILKSYDDVETWMDNTDLIQEITENFDYEATLSEEIDFSNKEFSTQFYELFQALKKEIIHKFCKNTLNLEVE